MLKPPHSRYDQLFVYNFDRQDLGPIDDPDLIGTWIEDGTAILFFHQDKTKLIEAIKAASKAEVIYQAQLDYRDWEAGLDITTFSVGALTVCPLWEEAEQGKASEEETAQGQEASAEQITIRLDPSVIFGSGFHATTRLCLETLSELYSEQAGVLGRVLELGCGTGLLAIATAKLGAREVLAVDHNPFACQVAEHNCKLNNCQDQVRVEQHDLRAGLPDTGVDLVIANLYKGLLTELFENPDFWQARYYLISGFIPGMEEDLLAALPLERLKLLERRQRDNWRLWLLANSRPAQP